MASTRAFEELLERLHAQGWSGLGFADIAFVHHTHVKRWYFTDKRGQLRRKLRRNLTLAKLVEAFSRNGEDAAVVALVIMHDGDDAPMKVAPLDAAGLRWLLLQGTGHRRMSTALMNDGIFAAHSLAITGVHASWTRSIALVFRARHFSFAYFLLVSLSCASNTLSGLSGKFVPTSIIRTGGLPCVPTSSSIPAHSS